MYNQYRLLRRMYIQQQIDVVYVHTYIAVAYSCPRCIHPVRWCANCVTCLYCCNVPLTSILFKYFGCVLQHYVYVNMLLILGRGTAALL